MDGVTIPYRAILRNIQDNLLAHYCVFVSMQLGGRLGQVVKEGRGGRSYHHAVIYRKLLLIMALFLYMTANYPAQRRRINLRPLKPLVSHY